MLPLDSSRWAELDHAYGKAGNVPELLRHLESFPSAEGPGEPWFSIWSALAHQGDVYSASFAAVPHVVNVLAKDPFRAGSSYIHFPAWVEICRNERGVTIPTDIEAAYFEALRQLPSLAVAALAVERDEGYVRCVLSAIAAANRQPALAEAVLELSPDVVNEFWDWFYSR